MYAISVTPSSRHAARIPSVSGWRWRREYWTWFEASGIPRPDRAAWALRIWASEWFDSPTARTFPASTAPARRPIRAGIESRGTAKPPRRLRSKAGNHGASLIAASTLRPREMPFWKREEKKPAPPPSKPAQKAEAPKAEAPAAAPAPAPPKPPATPEEIVNGVHHALVEAGLTVEGTRDVFRKRVEETSGSLDAFAQEYRADPPKAVTGFVASWLGFRVSARFTLDELLKEANQRLSSFGMAVVASSERVVDREAGMREATFTLQEQETVLRFGTPRDVLGGMNAMIQERGVRFLELETWTDDYAFILAKPPRWEKLASGRPVVIKAPETATDGECPQCGAMAGEKWASCISCGAPFA